MYPIWTFIVMAAWAMVAHKAVGQETCRKVATFNAAMLTNTERYDDRRKVLGSGLVENDADVYCLNEYWLESDMQLLLEQTSQVYKFHTSQIHFKVGELRKPKDRMTWWSRFIKTMRLDSPCSVREGTYFTFAVGGCMVAKGCLSEFMKSPLEGAACLASRCKNELKARQIDADCIQCIILNSNEITDPLTNCAPNGQKKENRLNPSGLMLLSKYELINVRYQKYFDADMSVQRGYLEAYVDGVGKVVCTHLSSIFPNYLEYDLDFKSYLKQQQNEIRILREKFGSVDHILMGDFNNGPVVENENEEKSLAGEFPANYALLEAASYRNPYMMFDGRCTFCMNNTLAADMPNVAIDFVLVKGNHVNVKSARRIMDRTTPFPYSDHYGVELEVCAVNEH